ncbi:MAG TPA: LysM peptidoglycan-binding domain-containing protein [Actinomycetota bacterium]|nr:LysM peptidoglycan-binding domain-containing protein [Actinomycetota bacterium]
MGLTKAYIELVETSGPNPPSLSATGTKIEFQYNPEKINVNKSAEWVAGKPNANGESSPPEYKGPQPTEMKLEMFIDASDKKDGDVSVQVEKLLEACAPTPSSKTRDLPLPSYAIFGWDKVYFRGFIKHVAATYSMFRETGKPVRATCEITLTEIPPSAPKQNPTSGGRGAQGWVQMVAGDTLAGIAFREYGDATLWRAIADANLIDDPLRLRPGTELLIPPAVDAAASR